MGLRCVCMYLILVVISAVTNVHSQYGAEYANGLKQYASNHNNYEPVSYSYAYGVSDPKTGDRKHHWEKRDGDSVQGEYGLVDPDGMIRIVQYKATPRQGFQATVQRIHLPPQQYQYTVGQALYSHDSFVNRVYGQGHGHHVAQSEVDRSQHQLGAGAVTQAILHHGNQQGDHGHNGQHIVINHLESNTGHYDQHLPVTSGHQVYDQQHQLTAEHLHENPQNHIISENNEHNHEQSSHLEYNQISQQHIAPESNSHQAYVQTTGNGHHEISHEENLSQQGYNQIPQHHTGPENIQQQLYSQQHETYGNAHQEISHGVLAEGSLNHPSGQEGNPQHISHNIGHLNYAEHQQSPNIQEHEQQGFEHTAVGSGEIQHIPENTEHHEIVQDSGERLGSSQEEVVEFKNKVKLLQLKHQQNQDPQFENQIKILQQKYQEEQEQQLADKIKLLHLQLPHNSESSAEEEENIRQLVQAQHESISQNGHIQGQEQMIGHSGAEETHIQEEHREHSIENYKAVDQIQNNYGQQQDGISHDLNRYGSTGQPQHSVTEYVDATSYANENNKKPANLGSYETQGGTSYGNGQQQYQAREDEGSYYPHQHLKRRDASFNKDNAKNTKTNVEPNKSNKEISTQKRESPDYDHYSYGNQNSNLNAHHVPNIPSQPHNGHYGIPKIPPIGKVYPTYHHNQNHAQQKGLSHSHPILNHLGQKLQHVLTLINNQPTKHHGNYNHKDLTKQKELPLTLLDPHAKLGLEFHASSKDIQLPLSHGQKFEYEGIPLLDEKDHGSHENYGSYNGEHGNSHIGKIQQHEYNSGDNPHKSLGGQYSENSESQGDFGGHQTGGDDFKSLREHQKQFGHYLEEQKTHDDFGGEDHYRQLAKEHLKQHGIKSDEHENHHQYGHELKSHQHNFGGVDHKQHGDIGGHQFGNENYKYQFGGHDSKLPGEIGRHNFGGEEHKHYGEQQFGHELKSDEHRSQGGIGEHQFSGEHKHLGEHQFDQNLKSESHFGDNNGQYKQFGEQQQSNSEGHHSHGQLGNVNHYKNFGNHQQFQFGDELKSENHGYTGNENNFKHLSGQHQHQLKSEDQYKNFEENQHHQFGQELKSTNHGSNGEIGNQYHNDQDQYKHLSEHQGSQYGLQSHGHNSHENNGGHHAISQVHQHYHSSNENQNDKNQGSQYGVEDNSENYGGKQQGHYITAESLQGPNGEPGFLAAKYHHPQHSNDYQHAQYTRSTPYNSNKDNSQARNIQYNLSKANQRTQPLNAALNVRRNSAPYNQNSNHQQPRSVQNNQRTAIQYNQQNGAQNVQSNGIQYNPNKVSQQFNQPRQNNQQYNPQSNDQNIIQYNPNPISQQSISAQYKTFSPPHYSDSSDLRYKLNGIVYNRAPGSTDETIWNAGDITADREHEILVRQINETCLYIRWNETTPGDEDGSRANIWNAGDYTAQREEEELIRSVNVTCQNFTLDAASNFTNGYSLAQYCSQCLVRPNDETLENVDPGNQIQQDFGLNTHQQGNYENFPKPSIFEGYPQSLGLNPGLRPVLNPIPVASNQPPLNLVPIGSNQPNLRPIPLASNVYGQNIATNFQQRPPGFLVPVVPNPVFARETTQNGGLYKKNPFKRYAS